MGERGSYRFGKDNSGRKGEAERDMTGKPIPNCIDRHKYGGSIASPSREEL
jgi:hypothetical protein